VKEDEGIHYILVTIVSELYQLGVEHSDNTVRSRVESAAMSVATDTTCTRTVLLSLRLILRLPVVTSAEGGYVFTSVYLSVCLSDN